METLIVRCPRSEDNKTSSNVGFFWIALISLSITNPIPPPDIFQVAAKIRPLNKGEREGVKSKKNLLHPFTLESSSFAES